MSTRLLPIAQSTDLVTYTILVNGQPLPNQYPLYALEVVNEVNRVPTASLYFADGNAATGEWTLSSEEFFVPGNEVTIMAGYHSEDEPLFVGIVVSQSLRVRRSRLELQIICKDKAIALTTTRRSRHFMDTTDSDAITQILGEYDVTPGILESTTITHTDLVQYDASDWDFIIMRLEANGLVCIADDTGLNSVVPSMDGEPVATIQFGANVLEFDANIDARRQTGAVTSRSWNPAAQDYATADGASPAWTTNGNLESPALATAVGADTAQIQHGGAVAADELQCWSDAVLLRNTMSFVRGRVSVKGFTAAKPGTVIELAGFGDRFNGPVWVSAVRHEISRGNWISHIEFGLSEEWHARRYQPSPLPASGLLAAVSGLHTGVVTALEGDPAGEARIRVKIPSINLEDEGVWARVSTLDAGASRGSFFLPEIDDEVLVGFLNDDPRHPVVLGMLHSSAHTPPETATDDNHIKGFYSRAGIRIVLDDDKIMLTIDTPGGHVFTLDDDAGEASLTDSNGNKITLSSSGISVESAADLVLKASGKVSIEGKTDMELKAGTQWKAEGNAGAELKSSGIAVLKGSLVQIN